MSVSNFAVVTLFFYFAGRSVVCYENVYDLLEGRQQRFYDPRYTPVSYYDRNPIVRSYSVYPTVSPSFGKVGNGYDNLGNGIPIGRFHPYRQQTVGDWRYNRRPLRMFGNVGLVRPQNNYGGHVYSPTGVPHLRGDDYDLFRGTEERRDYNRLFEDNEDKKQRQLDEFYLRTHGGVNSDSANRENVGEKLLANQAGENKSSLRSNKVIKKSRMTKGFAIHHHKDETGNSTTFFDENTDFGDQSDLRDLSDGFGSRRTLEQISQKGDEKYLKELESQTGNYGNGVFKGNEKYEKGFSSGLDHEDLKGEFRTGSDKDDVSYIKTYKYLNGEPFDDADHFDDNFY